MGTELKQCRETLDKSHSAPSQDEVEEQVRNKGKSEASPSTGISTKPTGDQLGMYRRKTAQAQNHVVNQQFTQCYQQHTIK